MGLGDRQQQPEAGPALAGFQPGQGAPGDPGRRAGRAEVTGYGVELVEDQVIGIESRFFVRLAGGQLLKARRILVATGVRDELPEIPGVRQRWGRDLLHCPYCHGWEIRGQPIGVLGTQPAMHSWCVSGPMTWSSSFTPMT